MRLRWQGMKVTTLACLFVSDGGIAVQLIAPPLPEEFHIPQIPAGMMHAVRVLGLLPPVRVFKLTAHDALPVYEEI